MDKITPKLLPLNQIEVVEELLFNFLDRNGLLDHSEISEVIKNVETSLKRKDGIVLVDDLASPTSFYWGWMVSSPHIVTKMVEMISMAGWHEEGAEDVFSQIVESAQKKAKIRGATDFFASKHFPFESIITQDGFSLFESAYHKKL